MFIVCLECIHYLSKCIHSLSKCIYFLSECIHYLSLVYSLPCVSVPVACLITVCNVFTAEDEMDEEDPTKNYKVGPGNEC